MTFNYHYRTQMSAHDTEQAMQYDTGKCLRKTNVRKLEVSVIFIAYWQLRLVWLLVCS